MSKQCAKVYQNTPLADWKLKNIWEGLYSPLPHWGRVATPFPRSHPPRRLDRLSNLARPVLGCFCCLWVQLWYLSSSLFITFARRYCDPSCLLVISIVRYLCIPQHVLGPSILKTAQTLLKWSAYRKWCLANRMVMWLMTSHDPLRMGGIGGGCALQALF